MGMGPLQYYDYIQKWYGQVYAPEDYDNRKYIKFRRSSYILRMDDIDITTHNGLDVRADVYDRIVGDYVKCMNEQNGEPNSEDLAVKYGMDVKFIEAIREDGVWKNKHVIMILMDKERFWRLAEVIKKCDYRYIIKINLIHTLSEMQMKDREFFYYLYGDDDGDAKSICAAEDYFRMEHSQASKIFLSALCRRHGYHRIYNGCGFCRCRVDRIYDVLVEFIGESDEMFDEFRSLRRRSLKPYL